MSERHLRCVMCREPIQEGDEYFFDEDHEKVSCEDCIFDYIESEYSIEQVLFGLDIQKRVYVKQKMDDTDEKTVNPIDGQIDMFGGTYHDEKENELPYVPVVDHG